MGEGEGFLVPKPEDAPHREGRGRGQEREDENQIGTARERRGRDLKGESYRWTDEQILYSSYERKPPSLGSVGFDLIG